MMISCIYLWWFESSVWSSVDKLGWLQNDKPDYSQEIGYNTFGGGRNIVKSAPISWSWSGV